MYGEGPMAHFIGIDGGGTGCRLRIVDGQGQTCAEIATGPANIALDPEGALQRITAAALAAAGHISGDPAGLLAASRATLGLAGANVAGKPEALLPHLPFGQSQILSDAVTTLHGALAGADGVVAALGTGSVFAVSAGGSYRQIGGWGFLLGDEASGGALGKAVLSQALRAVDGLTPMTPLLAGLLDDIGGPEAVVPFALTASSADFARFAPRLFQTEDAAACAILSEAERYIASVIEALRADADLPVCWIGGLGPAWAARLGARWPQLAAKGSALDGAVLLARSMQP